MALYGVSFVVTYVAWDTSANAGKTGDAGNHTLRWVKDGVSNAPANSPSEVDATNLPGLYKLTITATEAQATFAALGGKSSTASVTIMPVMVPFESIPTAAQNADAVLDEAMSGHAIVGSAGEALTAASGAAPASTIAELVAPPTRRRVVAPKEAF